MDVNHKPATAQDIFNTVALHLFTQGRPSSCKGGYCYYRGPNGMKCAVGALIPDENYYAGMEGKSVSGITLPAHLNAHRPLLHELQAMHDNTACNEDGTYKLENLKSLLAVCAQKHGLDSKV